MTIRNEKIANIILYFLKHTRNPGKTKLFKLLYFLDFMHFKKHGKSVTGYDYIVMPYGPVPKELIDQIDGNSLPADIDGKVGWRKERDEEDPSKYSFKFFPKKFAKADISWLSPYEQETLKEVAEIFRDSSASQMTEITHLKNTPWDRTRQQKGDGAVIDYFLALDDESVLSRDEIEERFRLQRELGI